MEDTIYRVTLLDCVAFQFYIKVVGALGDYFIVDDEVYKVVSLKPVEKSGMNWDAKQSYDIIANKVFISKPVKIT